MKKILTFSLLALIAVPLFGQAKFDAWNEFAKTKFEPKYYEKIGSIFSIRSSRII